MQFVSAVAASRPPSQFPRLGCSLLAPSDLEEDTKVGPTKSSGRLRLEPVFPHHFRVSSLKRKCFSSEACSQVQVTRELVRQSVRFCTLCQELNLLTLGLVSDVRKFAELLVRKARKGWPVVHTGVGFVFCQINKTLTILLSKNRKLGGIKAEVAHWVFSTAERSLLSKEGRGSCNSWSTSRHAMSPSFWGPCTPWG